MSDKGFAIRCPHCQKWNIWEKIDLKEAVISSKQELQRILRGFDRACRQGNAESFSHEKLWRCTNPRSVCPTSFEAVICQNEQQALGFLKEIEAWSPKRDFRLYKADCRNRWEDKYYGVLFNAQAIPRPQHVELELLMDRELVSRLIVGIGVELEAPVTIYAANVFAHPNTNKLVVYWMPIEAYSQGRLLVPPRYNEFCHTCRQIVMRKLTAQFEREGYNVNNCPIGFGKNDQCAGKDAVCMKYSGTIDWNRCPAFIEERKKRCPCYRSDLKFIERIMRNLRKNLENKGEFEEEILRCHKKRCYARFEERAIPIVVHGYLAGVAMSGQVFFDPKKIVNVNDFCTQFTILRGHERTLERAKDRLIAKETRLRLADKSRFFVTRKELDQRITLLTNSVRRVTRTATSRYSDVRRGTEWAFRQEILGYIQNSKIKLVPFDIYLSHVLERKRLFWAFEAVYLAQYSRETKCVSAIAFSHKYREPSFFGVPGKTVASSTEIEYDQAHPCPYLHKRGQQMPPQHDRLIRELLPIFENVATDPELEVPQGDDFFFVVIPFLYEVYAFVFAVRDEQIVREIESRVAGGVSRLCRESILETCTEVVYEFGEERFREARERAWREFSALASHRIGNEISSVGTLLDLLAEQLMHDSHWAPKWRDKLPIMQSCTRRAKEMLTLETMLTGEIKPRLQLTNLADLITKSATGIVPVDAKLDFQGSAAQEDTLLDPDLMEQAFRELCANAVDATGKDVQITVTVRKDKKGLHISFCDNGPGIRREDAERIFKPFITLRGGRTGLGLATVRRIVEAHAGTICLVESDAGADFVISLPQSGVKK